MKLLNEINGKNFINGKLVPGSGDCTDIINPANGQKIGFVPRLNEEQVNQAIDASIAGFNIWSKASTQERADFLRKWHAAILGNLDQLAKVLTLEQGKTPADAENEVKYGASFMEWYASILLSLEGSIKSGNSQNHKIIAEYEPIGPVAAITPWNFPVAMVTRKLAPAIAAGCSVVLKPSELTPLSALMLAKLADNVGLPAGVINVITGKSDFIGKLLCKHPKIRKLSFTGSTAAGKILYEQSAATLKKLSLELGGNAPFLILADADLEKTATDLITAKTRSNGQSCISPNRILIDQKIYADFIAILKEKFLKLKCGDSSNNHNDVGPLINNQAVEKISKLIQDAINHGAKLDGGQIRDNFFFPTILKDCNKNMKIFSTEIFGPVIACYSFKTMDEAVNLANDTEYGLQSYIYSKDISSCQQITGQLDFGMVSVNSPLPSNAAAPFGGRKFSGFGTEGSKEGLLEYMNIKYTNLCY